MQSIDNWETYLSTQNISKSTIVNNGRASKFMLSKKLNDQSVDDFANQIEDEVLYQSRNQLETERLNNQSSAIIDM